jgi:hypothetical protein
MQQSKKLKGNSNYFPRSLLFVKSKIPIGKAIMEPMKVHGLHKNDKRKKSQN